MTSERKRFPSSEQFWDNPSFDAPPKQSDAQKVFDFFSNTLGASGGDGTGSFKVTVGREHVIVIRGDAADNNDEKRGLTALAVCDMQGHLLAYGWAESRWDDNKSFKQNKESTKIHWSHSPEKPWHYKLWPTFDPS